MVRSLADRTFQLSAQLSLPRGNVPHSSGTGSRPGRVAGAPRLNGERPRLNRAPGLNGAPVHPVVVNLHPPSLPVPLRDRANVKISHYQEVCLLLTFRLHQQFSLILFYRLYKVINHKNPHNNVKRSQPDEISLFAKTCCRIICVYLATNAIRHLTNFSRKLDTRSSISNVERSVLGCIDDDCGNQILLGIRIVFGKGIEKKGTWKNIM